MEKIKIIESQAEEIAELREKLDYAKRAVDTVYRQYYEANEKAEKLEAENIKLKDGFKEATDKLLYDYERALEVIRGAGLDFDSTIIASEYQKGAED